MEVIKGITVHVEPCSNGSDLCDKELIEEIQNIKNTSCTDCNSKDCLNNGK